MEQVTLQNSVAEKLTKGLRFGLFGDSQECYFEDGTKIGYSALWKAIRETLPHEIAHHKTLFQVCPDTFVGIFKYPFSRHNWKK